MGHYFGSRVSAFRLGAAIYAVPTANTVETGENNSYTIM